MEQGYSIPFKEIPGKQINNNNKSARDNKNFVSEEVEKLLKNGCISQVSERPHVINPLTVAYGKSGKPRMVLDCRCINPHLVNIKYKYEDIKTAREMFEPCTYLFKFDIRSAYHHINIYEGHRKYLGFSWNEKYYNFNSLPFGVQAQVTYFQKF